MITSSGGTDENITDDDIVDDDTVNLILIQLTISSIEINVEADVEVTLEDSEQIRNKEVLIGEEAFVSIFIESKQGVLKVPIGAIFADSEGEYVMVFTGSDIAAFEETQVPTEKRYIERGMVSELYAEILSGVREGEQVIIVISSNEQGVSGEEKDDGKGSGALRLLK